MRAWRRILRNGGKWGARPEPPIPLSRRAFYDLTEECRRRALELARHDQHRVSLPHCHDFNAWLPRLQGYDLLAAPLRSLKPARPVTRWQVVSLGVALGIILWLLVIPSSNRTLTLVVLYGYVFVLVMLLFIPERFYGTTIELLEAKLLRVVEALDALLQSGQIELTQAAYFRAKEHLDEAKRELRQQIDLAHRP